MHQKRLRAVFLDRDGVINRRRENDYVKRWEEFEFLPNARQAVAELSAAGLLVFIVTNQRGIARKLYTHEDLKKVHDRMLLELLPAKVHGISYCPHAETEGCGCRKPEPGMLLGVMEKYGLNPGECAIIGDSESDIQAGKAAKLGTTILVGKRREEYAGAVRPDFFCKDLLDASNLLLAKGKKTSKGTGSGVVGGKKK